MGLGVMGVWGARRRWNLARFRGRPRGQRRWNRAGQRRRVVRCWADVGQWFYKEEEEYQNEEESEVVAARPELDRGHNLLK